MQGINESFSDEFFRRSCHLTNTGTEFLTWKKLKPLAKAEHEGAKKESFLQFVPMRTWTVKNRSIKKKL